MARKKKTETQNETTMQDWNRSLGYSEDALKALDNGTYGQWTNRKSKSMRSEDQASIANPTPIPALVGMKDRWESRLSNVKNADAALQYKRNLEDEAKKYTFNDATRKANTLDEKDLAYAQRLIDRFGDGDLARESILDKGRREGWETKYNKSLDQIYNDFMADQGNIKMEMGAKNPWMSEIGTIAGALPVALNAIPSVIANEIDPDSETAKKLEEARHKGEETRRYLRAGVKSKTGDKVDSAIDTINEVGDRMLPTMLGNAVGGNVLGGVFAGVTDLNKQLEDLRTRPNMTGRQRANTALSHAAVEGLGTGITSGILDAIPDANGLLGGILNTSKGAGNAAFENAVSEAIEMGADTLINGENSEKELNKALYMLNGMSEEEANKQATVDQWGRIKNAAFTGALFGGGIQGAKEAYKGFKNSKVPSLWLPDGKQDVDVPTKVDEVPNAKPEAELTEKVNNNTAPEPPAETPVDNAPIEAPKKGLEGYELEKAVAKRDKMAQELVSIKEQIPKQYEIANKAVKSKKNAEFKKLEALRAKEAGLTYDIYAIERKINGQSEVSRANKDMLTSLSKEIKKVGNMYGGKEGKAIAKDAIDALERYEKSGLAKDYFDFYNNILKLEGASTNTYTSKNGNSSTYSTYHNAENGGLLSELTAPPKDAEGNPNETFKALMSLLDMNDGKKAGDVAPDVPTKVEPEAPTQDVIPDDVTPKSVAPTGDGGEPPVPPVPGDGNVPPVEGDQKVRSFSKRGSQDEALPEEVRNALADDYYTVVHNADVEARATSLFNPEDLVQSRANLDRAIETLDPAAASLSYKLAKAYSDIGQYDAAIDVVNKASEGLTRGGQFTQAAKLAMLQNDPMAAMRAYIRDIEDLNTWGKKKYGKKWKDLTLTDEDVKGFNDIQKGDKEALNAYVDQLNDKFGKQIPSNWWDKTVAATKTSMLLNMRTQGRNIVANLAMLPVRSASDRVSALGQAAVSLFDKDFKRTQSLTGGTKEQKAIAGQIFDSMKEEILGENKWKDSTKSDILGRRQIFKDDALGKFIDAKTNGGLQRLNEKLGGNANKSILETLGNFTYWLMGDFGDTPFVKANFVNRLASYMKAQGIKSIDDVPDEAIAIAREEALKATFKDDNAFSNALTNVKKSTGKFGEVALPFVKTPANLAMRAVDFSPVGIVNTIRKAKSGADASKIVDELSKNLTGTAMIYLGYKLRENGLLSGNYSDNANEKAWQKQHGMLENAIHIGDNYYTIDWAQPTVTPMIIGSVMYDAIKNSDEENSGALAALNSAKKAGISVADSWLETSPLQSLVDIMGGGSYGSDSIAENVLNEIVEFPQRFFPAQMGAGEAFFAQNLNPGQLGNNNPTPLDDEIQRIYDATGNENVFPLNAGRYIKSGDKQINLTNEQHSNYQKTMGQRSYKLAEGLINSEGFKGLSDDEKASVLKKAYDLANVTTKEDLFDYTNDDNKKLKEAYRNGGEKAAVDYLLKDAKAKSLGLELDTYEKKEAEYSGGAEAYVRDKEKAADYGYLKKDGAVNMDAFEKAKDMFGNDDTALRAYSDYAAQGFTKNAEKVPYLEASNAFTNEQKGRMLTSYKEDGSINGQLAQAVYDMGGYEGMYYYYLLKNNAESNGKSGINKKERAAYFASDAPELDELWNLNQEMYMYLMNNLK